MFYSPFDRPDTTLDSSKAFINHLSQMQSARGTLRMADDARATGTDPVAAIPVVLTSVKSPSDSRHFTITEGECRNIGRASRSEAKDLHACSTNALFDCPVVSRIHAQLRVTSKEGDAKVTITDMGSMHGTVVNSKRIDSHVPFTLVHGDQIKFGDKVTRGSDIHDGVWVIFRQVASASYTQPSQTMRNTNSGFRVPSDSEDESDQDSDNDSVCIDAAPGLSSSAVTTPEQAKSTIEKKKVSSGTQEQPINIDADQLEVVISKANESQKEIKDTYAESMDGYLDLPRNGMNVDSEDEESTGCVSDEEVDDDDEDIDDEEEHEDNLSESDASDLSNHYDESEAEGPEVMSSKKEASPELGTPADALKAKTSDSWYAKTSQTHPFSVPKAPTPNRSAAYDPIRGSLPQSSYERHGFWAPPVHTAKPYGFGAPYNDWEMEPRADPAFSTQSASIGPQSTSTSNPYYTPYSSYIPAAGSFSGVSYPHPPLPLASTLPHAYIPSRSSGFNGVRPLHPTPAVPIGKSRISITDIVDESSYDVVTPGVIATVDDLGMEVPGNKRKASMISRDVAGTSDEEWVELYHTMQSKNSENISAVAAPAEAQPNQDVALAGDAVQVPAQDHDVAAAPPPVAKKAKTMSSVGWEATKYAGAALFGGMGTVAFLASPLAAKLLESL